MKAYTDIEQSKKLEKILPLESADMSWCNKSIRGVNYTDSFSVNLRTVKEMREVFDEALSGGWDKYWELMPCWSLTALLDALPEIQGSKPVIALDDNYITYPHMGGLQTKAGNLVDACYEMIIKLHEQKLLWL